MMENEKTTLKIECSACKGTGIYKGFAEPQGVGVVCLECNGTGCTERTFTIFKERKKRDDIKTVRLSSEPVEMRCCNGGL
jgi:DnaJ-class molecular chaperone